MNESENRRSELRLGEQATIFIELQSADYASGEDANILICNSLDVSANGMQIELDREVAVGSIFRLGVNFPDNGEPIYLVGEVRWVRAADTTFNIGFALFDSEQTGIDVWKSAIARRLKN